MKNDLKLYGAEALYLLGMTIVAFLFYLVQTIGKVYERDYSSFIFSGSVYRYNYFFYFLGWVLFAGALFAGYKYFLKERMSVLAESRLAPRIFFSVIAVVFTILMFAAVVFAAFLTVGMNDVIEPKILFNLTVFGFPILNLVFMGVTEYLAVKDR